MTLLLAISLGLLALGILALLIFISAELDNYDDPTEDGKP